MSLVDRLIRHLAPYECLACGEEGELICPACLQLFPDVPPRCYSCRQVSPAWLTCSHCRKSGVLRSVQAVTDYESIAQQLVWQLKFAGAQGAARQIGKCMLPAIRNVAAADTLIVPAPTASSHMRRRGYDQAKLIARSLARQSGLIYADCLIRSGQSHQVGASRERRLRQLEQAFRAGKLGLVQGAHIVLIDDVVTTGATLEAAAAALRRAGADRVDAIVFAQP